MTRGGGGATPRADDQQRRFRADAGVLIYVNRACSSFSSFKSEEYPDRSFRTGIYMKDILNEAARWLNVQAFL